jgi:hypothetical protein
MPELLRILEHGEATFGEVRVKIAEVSRILQFPLTSVTRSGFVKVLNLRPFDQLPGQLHRYFFARSTRKLENGGAEVGIRVEVGNDAETSNVTVPLEFAANLVWLSELKDWSEVSSFLVDDAAQPAVAGAPGPRLRPERGR